MEKNVERLGYGVSFNPPGDGELFYASAAKALEIETQGLKKVIFDFLKSHQFDASIQLIANSRTAKISLCVNWQRFLLGFLAKIHNNHKLPKSQSSDPRCVLLFSGPRECSCHIRLAKCQQVGRCLADKTRKQICTASAVSTNITVQLLADTLFK